MSVIAVATDFSTRSDRAIRRAELLAAQAGCDLLVVHVIDEDQPQSLIHAESDACEDLLRDQQEAIAKDGRTKVTTDLRIGEAFEQIPRAATDAGAMLIVMGPHRWQAARSAFIGTTVERTVKNSPLPVLVANSPPAPGYDRVLVTTSLNANSATSIRFVNHAPFLQGAEVLLLHVYDSADMEMQSRAMIPAEERRHRQGMDRLYAQEMLAGFAEENGLKAGRYLVRESCGSVAADIMQAASEQKADLITIAPGTKSFLELAIVGRISHAILRRAECDVLVFPALTEGENSSV
ncbi:MAG: universal stress protein [Novosphingobium sp.]|nr:universal stress protein [Novosphingobium sp.]MCP5400921.1 universal stress protein [Novosphingobium sp.]